MLIHADEGDREFAVIHRWLDDTDALHLRLLALITHVPRTADVAQVKGLIEAVGRTLLEGVAPEAAVDWQHGCKVVPDVQWDAALKAEVALLADVMTRGDGQYYGVPLVSDRDNNDVVVLLHEDKGWFCRRVSHAALQDSLKGEKRITLCLPLDLYLEVGRAAFAEPDGSLNAFCLQTLAHAVGHGDRLEEYEARRQKAHAAKKPRVHA